MLLDTMAEVVQDSFLFQGQRPMISTTQPLDLTLCHFPL